MRRKLSGGDRRSIGNANAVAKRAAESQKEFDILIAGLTDADAIIRMRSADAAEKASQKNPALLTKHRRILLQGLKGYMQQEVCWHVALMLPRLSLTAKEARLAADQLLQWVQSNKSKIVIVNSLQGLWELSAKFPSIRPQVVHLIEQLLQSGSPAVKARARKLLAVQE